MRKFVVLYAPPPEPVSFDEAYLSTHLPLVAKVPGLVRAEVSTVRRVVYGDLGLHLMAELYFADGEALRTALNSPEWAATGDNLREIGGLDLATMYVADVTEVLRPDEPQYTDRNSGHHVQGGAR